MIRYVRHDAIAPLDSRAVQDERPANSEVRQGMLLRRQRPASRAGRARTKAATEARLPARPWCASWKFVPVRFSAAIVASRPKQG
ncbi:hypothetical protein GWL_32330 [Herbaspirillum sp. GW103]|nr:hypothetical protein GWL_32330 [Herbaspirillum sp. GW103]